MATVSVKPSILQWAIDRSGLIIEDIHQRFPKIRQWISGEKQPSLRQVESLAKMTSTPLGFFFLEKPPEEELPIPHFRTLGDDRVNKPSPDLLETVHTMQQRQFWMHEFLVEQGNEKIPFVRSATLNEKPTLMAEKIRDTLDFEANWASSYSTWTDALRTLLEALEDAGVMPVVNGVVGNNTHRKLEPSEFRGFVLVDDYAPLVFINGADSKAAQMFTLAHELAHLLLGSSAAFDLREMSPGNNRTEKTCDLIAAEFLVPEKHLRQIWWSINNDLEPFQSIARRFKVSPLVAARRALDLQLIKKSDFLKFYNSYLKDERRTAANREDGGNFYSTQNLRVGRRFASTVIRAVKEGKLLYSQAYKLTGLYGKTFEHYTSSLGMGGV